MKSHNPDARIPIQKIFLALFMKMFFYYRKFYYISDIKLNIWKVTLKNIS